MNFFELSLIVIVIFTVFHIREKIRRRDLEVEARKFGFKFCPKGRRTTFEEHQSFRLFSQGRRGEIKNEMWGQTNGFDLKIFGYHNSDVPCTVVSIQNSGIRLPDFQLEPEGIFNFISEFFGYQDINIASNPEFSRQFLLRGHQENRIREFFTDDVMNLSLTNRKISVESKDRKIIFYETSPGVNPGEIHKLINLANELVEVFKAAVEHSRQPTEIRPDPSPVISYDWPGR